MRVHRALALAIVLVGLLWGASGSADDVAVPIALQVELLVKVAAYDRNLPPRAAGTVRTLILTRSGSADSARAAAQIDAALKGQGPIAGLPHEESTAAYADAAALAKIVKAQKISIVYVTPGFADDEIVAIARGFDGGDVLTVGAVPGFVPRGIVLGFDLVSGKSKLLCHLEQAKRQNVALSAAVLKLMTVYP
jgi:hypothetical protein